MKYRYLVTVSADLPYPVTKSFTVESSSWESASRDGIRKFKEFVKGKVGRKRFEELSIKVRRTGKTNAKEVKDGP